MTQPITQIATEPTYQAANAVAARVEEHFARHLYDARAQGETEVAPLPDADTIARIVDATFWASLRREEGLSPQISVAYVRPEQTRQPLVFARSLSLTPKTLTKLAPAVERPGIHLGVWSEEGELRVWGATRSVPGFCFVLEVIEPGLLVIKHRRRDVFGKFANVVVLKGEQIKIVDEQGTSLPDCPALLKSLLAFTSPASLNNDPVHMLIQLAASMRAHRHGGSLLVVPTGSEKWRNSIVHPILYSTDPPFSVLKDLLHQEVDEDHELQWENKVRKTVDTVAGLTAVDGATVINDEYEVLAFGAKIRRGVGSEPVEQMVVTEPIVGDRAEVVAPVQHGGTRHMSAAQFVFDQRDSLALVASQDGRFTIFAWSPCENMVHAHRVDVLLM
jgi:hypothetical protein